MPVSSTQNDAHAAPIFAELIVDFPEVSPLSSPALYASPAPVGSIADSTGITSIACVPSLSINMDPDSPWVTTICLVSFRRASVDWCVLAFIISNSYALHIKRNDPSMHSSKSTSGMAGICWPGSKI